MKTLLFFFFLALTSIHLFAQNFNVAFPFRAQYFALTDQNINSTLNWSPVKVIYIDSINAISGGINFFSFDTWKDTSQSFDPVCIEEAAPSWIGSHIAEMNNGFSLFYNYNGDTIFLKTNALTNDTFNFMALSNSGFVIASLDSITWMQQANIQDSVKCFSLLAYDSTGVIIPNHKMNGLSIHLSKSNGFFKSLNFRDLPDNPFELNRIDSVPMISWADVYDYNPGDEFEYYGECGGFGGPQPPAENFVRILDKFYSPGMDSVYYHRYTVVSTYVPNPNGNPPYIPWVLVSEDTLRYFIDQTFLFQTYPEENLYNLDSSDLRNYTLRKDSSWHFDRPEYTQIFGFLIGNLPLDSCILYNHFEPVFYTLSYSTGLGLTYYESIERNIGGQNCYTRLTYYKKGSEIFGTFVDLTLGLPDEIKNEDISIYPNPVQSICHINWPGMRQGNFILYDLYGRIIRDEQVEGPFTIDVRSLESGVYILSIECNGATHIKKIIKE